MKSLYLEGKNRLDNLFKFLTILIIREILMFTCLLFILFRGVLFPVDAENYIASLPVVAFKKLGVYLSHLFCKLNKPTPFRLSKYVTVCKLLVDQNYLKMAHIVLDEGCPKMDMILFHSSFSRAK